MEQCIRLWALGQEFYAWGLAENQLCSTLVDWIVTGDPPAEAQQLWGQLGYRDDLLNTGSLPACITFFKDGGVL